MDEQTFSQNDFLQLGIYLGSLTYLLGLVYQLWITFRQDKKLKLKALTLALLTRLLTITSTFMVWTYWTTKIDIMFGFILLPAFIPELIFSPLLLRLFGYRLWRTNNISQTMIDRNKLLALTVALAYHIPILYFSIITNEHSLEIVSRTLKWNWYFYSLTPIFMIAMYFDINLIYVVFPSILFYASLFYFLILLTKT